MAADGAHSMTPKLAGVTSQNMNTSLDTDNKEIEMIPTSQEIIPQVIDATTSFKATRKIYIVKQEMEPKPIIIVITKDMVHKYPNQHIVYPKGYIDDDPHVEYKDTTDTKTDSNTSSQVLAPQVIDTTAPRKILVIKDINEPTPIITLITQDMIHQYPNQHIVYPQSQDNRSEKSENAMTMHYANNNDIKSLNICGASDVINDDKRIPSTSPNKYNLMYGRYNLFIIIYLWILFIVWQTQGDNFTNTREYCSQFDCDRTTCNFAKLCISKRSWYRGGYHQNCLHDEGCSCCIEEDFVEAYSHKEFIAFNVFLGINAVRLFIIALVIGCKSILKPKAKLYVTNPNTNKVKLQPYMNYLCDQPVSYIIGIFNCKVNKAMKESIIYGISFPTTRFLYCQMMIFYVPFATIISIFVARQILFQRAAANLGYHLFASNTPQPTSAPTPPRPTRSSNSWGYYDNHHSPSSAPTPFVTPDSISDISPDLLIVSCLGLVFLYVGFFMHCYRWRRKNIIERQNIERIAQFTGKEIIASNDTLLAGGMKNCTYQRVEAHKRSPSESPMYWNLVYRWINAIMFVWLLVAAAVLSIYEWKEARKRVRAPIVAYVILLILDGVRIFFVTLSYGIMYVDNEYNYIIDKETGKVKLRYFMDYLCDHPTGIIIGFLYPDAGKAIKEGLIWNIAFPQFTYSAVNICVFYLPMMGMNIALASHARNEKIVWMYVVTSVLCGVGAVSNLWRIKMKYDKESFYVDPNLLDEKRILETLSLLRESKGFS